MTQLKRTDWLEHGLMKLAQHGVDAVTIDALCKDLGVTKGSFYHHFKNRQAFLTAVLEFWEDEYTSRFIDYSQEGEQVAQQLERLNEMVLKSFGQYEVHIRAWAQADPLAREFQTRVDQRRIDYLEKLYQHRLQDETQARAMAHLIYSTLIGSTAMMPALTRDDYEAMMALVGHMIRSHILEDKP